MLQRTCLPALESLVPSAVLGPVAPASLGNSLEMQNLGPHLRFTESEILGGRGQQSVLISLPGDSDAESSWSKSLSITWEMV